MQSRRRRQKSVRRRAKKPARNLGYAFDILAAMPGDFMKSGRKDRVPPEPTKVLLERSIN